MPPRGTSNRSSTARASRASSAASRARSSSPRPSPRATRASSRELDSAGLREAMEALAEIQELVGRAGYYAVLSFTTDTADPARGALLQRVQEHETALADDAAVLRARVGGAARRARRGAARRRGARVLPPPPAQRAPLPRPPALRARGEDPRREGAHRRERVDAAVRGAHLGDRGASCRASDGAGDGAARASGSRSTSPSAGSRCADREVRRSAAEAVTAALAPGLRTRAYLFNTLLADKATDDRLRQLPELDRRAQPRQRGERRVRPGADRGGARAL